MVHGSPAPTTIPGCASNAEEFALRSNRPLHTLLDPAAVVGDAGSGALSNHSVDTQIDLYGSGGLSRSSNTRLAVVSARNQPCS